MMSWTWITVAMQTEFALGLFVGWMIWGRK